MQRPREMAAFSVYVCLPSSSLPPSFSPLFPLSLRASHVSWASLICSRGWLGTHVFLPPRPKYWDYRHVPLLPGYAMRIKIRVLPGIHSANQVHINCIPNPVLIHHLCNQTITEHLSCKYFYFFCLRMLINFLYISQHAEIASVQNWNLCLVCGFSQYDEHFRGEINIFEKLHKRISHFI